MSLSAADLCCMVGTEDQAYMSGRDATLGPTASISHCDSMKRIWHFMTQFTVLSCWAGLIALRKDATSL